MSIPELFEPEQLFLASLVGLLGVLVLVIGVRLKFADVTRADSRTFRRMGVGLLIVALVARLGIALLVGTGGLHGPDPYPQYAESIAAGRGYMALKQDKYVYPQDQAPTPTAFWPPGWPFALGTMYKLFGVSGATTLGVTTALSMAFVSLIWFVSRMLFGSNWALVSANLAAWHPSEALWGFSTQSDLLFVVLFAMTLTALVGLARALGWRQRPSFLFPILVLILGVSGGALTLTRGYGIVLFLGGLAMLPMMVKARRFSWRRATDGDNERDRKTGTPHHCAARRRQVLAVALPLLVALAVIGVWLGRNAVVMDAWIPVSTNSGVNLWIGNNPKGNIQYDYPPIPPSVTQDDLAAMTETERDDTYRRAAVAWIVSHPQQFVIRGIKKVIYVYASDLSSLSGLNQALLSEDGSNAESKLGRRTLLVLVGLFNGYYWALLVLAGAGAVLLLRARRFTMSYIYLYPALVVAAIAFVFFASGRFHWIAYPSLIVLTTAALAEARRHAPPRRSLQPFLTTPARDREGQALEFLDLPHEALDGVLGVAE